MTFLRGANDAGFVWAELEDVGLVNEDCSWWVLLQRWRCVVGSIFKRTPHGGLQNDDADCLLYIHINTHTDWREVTDGLSSGEGARMGTPRTKERVRGREFL